MRRRRAVVTRDNCYALIVSVIQLCACAARDLRIIWYAFIVLQLRAFAALLADARAILQRCRLGVTARDIADARQGPGLRDILQRCRLGVTADFADAHTIILLYSRALVTKYPAMAHTFCV